MQNKRPLGDQIIAPDAKSLPIMLWILTTLQLPKGCQAEFIDFSDARFRGADYVRHSGTAYVDWSKMLCTLSTSTHAVESE
jgi:hypothetical protein